MELKSCQMNRMIAMLQSIQSPVKMNTVLLYSVQYEVIIE